jgi:hypothetical protein
MSLRTRCLTGLKLSLEQTIRRRPLGHAFRIPRAAAAAQHTEAEALAPERLRPVRADVSHDIPFRHHSPEREEGRLRRRTSKESAGAALGDHLGAIAARSECPGGRSSRAGSSPPSVG